MVANGDGGWGWCLVERQRGGVWAAEEEDERLAPGLSSSSLHSQILGTRGVLAAWKAIFEVHLERRGGSLA